MKARLLLLAAGVLLLTSALYFRRSTSKADRSPLAPPPPPLLLEGKPSARPADPAVESKIASFAPALTGSDREALRAAARTLRDRLLAFPELLKEAVATLRDPRADASLRAALAVVLGTLPGARQALVDALRDKAVTGLERTVILALGIREPESATLFAADDRPFSMEPAAGLAVRVAGALERPEERALLAQLLESLEDPAARRAAARVLRDSTTFEDVRKALLGRLGRESDPETSAEAAAALCAWTVRVPPGDGERDAAMTKILELAPASEEIVRFRLAAPLSGTRLSDADRAGLLALASHEAVDVRRFAVDVLGKRLQRPEEADGALALLAQKAVADPSPHVREAAALALGARPLDPQALQSLRAALAQDRDWEVRAAAVRSLGRAQGSGPARDALRQAAEADPILEVRTAAARALAAFR